jgi:hypothetical protein
MAEFVVIALIVGCFALGSLRPRFNFGSRQEVLQMFNRFWSVSHRQAFDYASLQRPH